MLKFSSLFKEDGEGGGTPSGPASSPPSNVASDVATTGLQRKVTHDDLRKQRELEETEFSSIFSKTWSDTVRKK